MYRYTKSNTLTHIPLHAIKHFNTCTGTQNHTLKHIYRYTKSNTLTHSYRYTTSTWNFINQSLSHISENSTPTIYKYFYIVGVEFFDIWIIKRLINKNSGACGYTQSHTLTHIPLHTITHSNTYIITHTPAL